MLRGKEPLLRAEAADLGEALAVWLTREGVSVDYCARRPADIRKPAPDRGGGRDGARIPV